MNRVLLVEDDASLIDGLEYAMRKNGFDPDVARTEVEAIAKFTRDSYDLILLDVALGNGSGFTVCAEVRRLSSVPIVFLTASDGEASVVKGLDLGGDDYVTKPFRLTELFARINAVMRRARLSSPAPTAILSNGIALDVVAHRATADGRRIDLTEAEFRLLKLFMENANAVLTRERILERLWDADGVFVDDNTLSVLVNRLRGKIERDPSAPRAIRTVRGAGYRWDDADDGDRE